MNVSPRSRARTINEAKKILATEATALVHGRAAADEAAATARTTFEEGGLGASSADGTSAAVRIWQPDVGVLAAFVKAGLCRFERRSTSRHRQ